MLVASVEKRPLRFSDRILILHLSGIKNTNMKFSDTEMTILEEWGSLPILARSAETELTLDGDFPDGSFTRFHRAENGSLKSRLLPILKTKKLLLG